MALTGKRLQDVAGLIMTFEARRDKRGRIQVYQLPKGDGGGHFEIAGINDRYHPEQAKRLRDLITAGEYDEAEQLASTYIASYTDVVASWTTVDAVEAFLRDTAFNRGPGGAVRILQAAVGVEADGKMGPRTRAAVRLAEKNPGVLLDALRRARECYERDHVGRDPESPFWPGLVKRWDRAEAMARALL